jgi:hypothetical protein
MRKSNPRRIASFAGKVFDALKGATDEEKSAVLAAALVSLRASMFFKRAGSFSRRTRGKR